jgi:hypothetical protein
MKINQLLLSSSDPEVSHVAKSMLVINRGPGIESVDLRAQKCRIIGFLGLVNVMV